MFSSRLFQLHIITTIVYPQLLFLFFASVAAPINASILLLFIAGNRRYLMIVNKVIIILLTHFVFFLYQTSGAIEKGNWGWRGGHFSQRVTKDRYTRHIDSNVVFLLSTFQEIFYHYY